MSLPSTSMRLSVKRIEGSCLFDLAWGDSQQLSATVPYPSALETSYQQWLRAYLNFYNHLPKVQDSTCDSFRGRVVKQGQFQSESIDWQAELVKAEAALFYQFHQWLRHQDLFDLRAQIRQLARSLDALQTQGLTLDIFLSCNRRELTRLPWEQWELSSELSTRVPIRIARCPIQLRVPGMQTLVQRKRLRVLAILGDEQGLDFKGDRDAIQALAPKADVHFVGWQPQRPQPYLKQEICDEIADEMGWDILFFAGHSNETALTGGEVTIAPNQILSIQELSPYLKKARDHGLQLAIFNSCCGSDIATALLELGLSQVAVMREPVHNQVAQAFLRRFLLHVSNYIDIHSALNLACDDLKRDQSVTFPSAYCLPSLFRHPKTQPYQLPQTQAWDWLKPWIPTRREAIALSLIIVASLLPSVRETLLDIRLWGQAIYRDATGQFPTSTTDPPVTLVQVDEESLRKSQLSDKEIKPLDRVYLSGIIERLIQNQANIIGVDYLLDRPRGEQDEVLAKQIQASLVQKTWLTFGAVPREQGQPIGIHANTNITTLSQTMEGDVSAYPGYFALPPSFESCVESCPFAYLLALLSAYQGLPEAERSLQPALNETGNLRQNLIQVLGRKDEEEIASLRNHQLSPLTKLANQLNQRWLYPILDYSIPEQFVYRRLPAWKLLEIEDSVPKGFYNRITIIAAGGYKLADDTLMVPLAKEYWNQNKRIGNGNSFTPLSVFTGAEDHAYAIHHFLTRRMVVPIPDLWIILVAAVLGKVFNIKKGSTSAKFFRLKWILYFSSVAFIYYAIALQLYISVAILFPWLLPSLIVGIYTFPGGGMKMNANITST